MVAKITIGSSLFGAIKYNADKVNIGKGQLLDTNKVFNNGDGKVNVSQVLADFEKRMPRQMRTEKPVIHISLNPHPNDRLTDGELTQIAHEYMQRMGYGDQPYIIVKHEVTATSSNEEALPSSGTLNRDTDCIMATSGKR